MDQPKYQDKEWLQEELNNETTATAVAKKHGWGKNTIARWIKRLEVSYPEPVFIETEPYHNKEWLRESYERLGNAEAIAKSIGVGSTVINTYLEKYDIRPKNMSLSKEGLAIAKSTYQDKYWLAEKMKEFGTAKAVAESIGAGESTIQEWAKKLNVHEPTVMPDTTLYKDKNWLENQFMQGKRIKDVAEQFAVDENSIKRYISMYKIDTKKLQATHKYPFKNKEWLEKEFEKHKSGKAIADANGLAVTSVNRYIRKFGINPHKIADAITLKLNHDYFERIDTEEKAYWLGFLMADGYVVERKTGANTNTMIGMKLKSSDYDVLSRFKKTLKTNAVIRETKTTRNGKVNHGREISFYSKKTGKDLAKHGIVPRKTGIETLPKGIPSDLIRHFVRGFFDGDGSASQGIFSICVSHFLYEDMRKLIISLGVSPEAIKRTFSPGVLVLRVHRKKEVEKIAKWMYEDATIYLDRKRKIYVGKGFLR